MGEAGCVAFLNGFLFFGMVHICRYIAEWYLGYVATSSLYTANSVKRSSQIRRSAVAQMIPDAESVVFPCSNRLNDQMEN